MIPVNWNPSEATLRQFAWVCLPGFSLAGVIALFRFHNHPAACLFFILAVVTPVLGLARPAWVKPVYIGLTAVTFPIGFVISNLILAAIYFLVFTPVAVFFKLIGRDALLLRTPAGTGNWIDSKQSSRRPADYYRPF